MLTHYPLIKPYPLIEPDRAEGKDCWVARDAALGTADGPLQSLLSIPGPYEHVQIATTGRGADNTLPSLIDSKLWNCDAYKEATGMSMPLENLPSVTRYREEHDGQDPSKNIRLNADANLEVLKNGYFLPSGQALLHGGPWPWSGVIGQFDRPLSCTLCAKVARLHAGYHVPDAGEIWIITVLPRAEVKGIVLNRWGEHHLGHEIEILLQSGAVLEKRYSRWIGPCLVHDVNLVGTRLP